MSATATPSTAEIAAAIAQAEGQLEALRLQFLEERRADADRFLHGKTPVGMPALAKIAQWEALVDELRERERYAAAQAAERKTALAAALAEVERLDATAAELYRVWLAAP